MTMLGSNIVGADTQNPWIQRHEAALVGNYGKLPVVLTRGRGSRLWDDAGREYLDLFAGFGGTILGHCHPALVSALTQQAQTLWAVGNQFYSQPQVQLAERLRSAAFDGRVFLCHSGAEAAEAAIKLARLAGGSQRTRVISMHKGFHGRTLGALSATAGPAQNGFAPLLSGFVHVEFNNISALEGQMDGTVSAVILEPIQGEGGMNMPAPDYLPAVRKLCDRHGATLIFDEVWTGVGRTGQYFGHQHFGVLPDIMTMGKALGGGVPMGGILARPAKAEFFTPGTHGCTLGGNPICAAVSNAVLATIEKDGLLEQARESGELLRNGIAAFNCAGRCIKEIRGFGLFLGVELCIPDAAPVVRHALAHGLIINATQKNVLRICPSLVISRTEIQRSLEILEAAIESV